MKQCNHCLKWKDEEEFNWRYKPLGIRHSTCRECQKPFRRAWYEGSAKERHLANVKERKQRVRDESRQFLWEYLSSHPCESCGESDPTVLEFHHDKGDKEMEVSAMVGAGYSINSILKEISKCTVLCSNCHRRLTAKERGWFKGRR